MSMEVKTNQSQNAPTRPEYIRGDGMGYASLIDHEEPGRDLDGIGSANGSHIYYHRGHEASDSGGLANHDLERLHVSFARGACDP